MIDMDDVASENGSKDHRTRKEDNRPRAAVDTPEQKKLKEQILYHANQVIQLKHALNSRRPTIAKLPPEVLAEIFLHQATIVQQERVTLHEEQGGAEIHKSFYEWTNVTQVCHHWRDVALQCPRLWTWLAFEEHVSSHLTDIIAERSHDLPLTVVLTINSQMMHCDVCLDPDGQCQYPDMAFWMVNQKLPRIRELMIFIDREVDRMWAVGNIWDPVVEDPAPLLENLRIEAGQSTRYTQEDSSRPAELAVRKGLFAGQTPKLRSLTLGGVGVRFTNPLFCSTLRTLKIEDCQCWRPNAQPDFNAWLLVLKRLTRLEVLEVDWSIASANGEIEYQPVSVPKLKHLHMETTVAAFADHMKYVKLPRGAAVRFSCTDANLLDQVRMTSLREATSSLFEQMSISCVSYGTIYPRHEGPGDSQLVRFPSCQLWATEGSNIKPSDVGPASSPLPLEGTPPRLTFDCGLDTLNVPLIFGTVDLSRVHTVHVAHFPSGNEWARVLKNAPNVITLYAHGIAAFGLPVILAGGIPDDLNLDFLSGPSIEAPDQWFWATSSPVDTDAIVPDDDDRDGDQGTLDAPSEEGSTVALFPLLHTLKFVSVDFLLVADAAADAHRVTGGDLLAFEERGLVYGFDVEVLVASLRIRQAQGAADIACVDFIDGLCGDMAQLACLVATVPEVRWDGKRVDSASLSS
ncbi:hypothetical protein GSI_00595 [Ganoderma sinense ZZ0214-1]|uniref:F-box domain-containing protein n=1 Tax=Ganoderma sinense ZZ0214-1 TaxID=1077348 RepID=A0A2G8ST06_9APHY|nr:hypothetical protein GSI_00595 [Ganoderma sinense ZZ0214-1]